MGNEFEYNSGALTIYEFLNIKQSIVDRQYDIPKIFKRIYIKFFIPYYKGKLYKILDKINDNNKSIILNKNNIEELLSNVYSTFPIERSFSDLINIEYKELPYDSSVNLIRGTVNVSENVIAVIKNLINNEEKTVEISFIIKEGKSTKSFEFIGKELRSNNTIIGKYIDELNEKLVSIMVDYIKYLIKET